MYIVPLQMMHFDLSFIPGNLGDGRLNNYFLEHGHKWLQGQVESFWNAPFCYPTIRTMSFSDNYLGTLPIYALFRFLHFDRETSYQLWFLAVFTLNYFSCVWVLKKLYINALGIAAGAFVFTFSLPVIARMGHSQLLPRFMIPFAFYFALRYFERPDFKMLAATCLAVVIQFYCTIYMGFFLVLGLFSLLLAFVLLQDNRLTTLQKIVYGSYRTITLRIIIILFSLLSLLPLIIPYYKTSLEYGLRHWEEISQMLPRIKSYFYPAGGSLLWNWLSPMGSSLPMSWEHQIFIGMIPLTAFIVMPVFCFRYREDPLVKKGMITWVAIALLVLLTLHFGSSFYKLAPLLPGLGAIRAVTRIILMMLFPLSVVLGVVLTKLSVSRGTLMRSSVTFIISGIILFAIVLDQNVKPSSYMTYSKAESQNRSKTVERLVRRGGSQSKIFAYMPDRSSDPPYEIHLDAMLAAQNLSMASVNGYSAILPANYDFYSNYDQCDSFFKWKTLSAQKYGPYYENEDLLKDCVIVGRECPVGTYSYTIMATALPNEGYKAKITFDTSQLGIGKNAKIYLNVHLTNISQVTWGCLSAANNNMYKISLSYRWLSNDRMPMGGFDPRLPLPHDLHFGETTTFQVPITVPPKAGTYFLEFDLVQEHVTWFHIMGSPTSLLEVEVL
jgi:hypothetical protein